MQGGIGFRRSRGNFPDNIAVEYDLLVSESDGLIITFVAMRGIEGEDAIDDLPSCEGYFRDYTGEDAPVRSYHVSVRRYNDRGEHAPV